MEHDIKPVLHPFLEREPTEEGLAQAVVEARNILAASKRRKHQLPDGVVNIGMEPEDDIPVSNGHLNMARL